MKKRFRATFLLRCMVLIAGLAIFVPAAMVLLKLKGMGLVVSLFVLLGVWFIGLEMGILPFLMERWLLNRAARSGRPVNSIWFMDLDAEEAERSRRLHETVEGDQTL